MGIFSDTVIEQIVAGEIIKSGLVVAVIVFIKIKILIWLWMKFKARKTK